VTIWLKLIGAVDAPMPERWLDARKDLHDEVGFSTRAKVDIADELVMYAIPQRRIVGIAEVQSHPSKRPKTGEERWPWRSNIRWQIAIADYDRCPTLEDIEEPGGRNLRASVQRQSHIGLRWGEYRLAKTLLDDAFDSSLGDLRS
jgi:hypothetical protein